MFTCVLWREVASTVILVPEPFEGADRVAGQLRGDKECPFSGVTKSGRVWRKVPEIDARSVVRPIELSSPTHQTQYYGHAKNCLLLDDSLNYVAWAERRERQTGVFFRVVYSSTL